VQEMLNGATLREWPTYYRYDDIGRMVFTANPSAFQQSSGQYYDDTKANLLAPTAAAPVALDTSDVRINTTTSNWQYQPSVARDAFGNTVIVWTSLSQDGSGDGVYARVYDEYGTALTSEFRVNQYTTSAQNYPDVAMDANGDFVVVWQSSGQDG